MHIPDGFVSPQITIPAYAVCAPLWAWAVRRHFGHSSAESLPVVGSLTAVAFVIQTIMIPVPGGTSTHLVGVTLLALLYHPLVAFVCESLVLLIQALFFGAGGVTVLGVNALAMGLLGPLAGWLVFRTVGRLFEKGAAFLAAYVAMQISTLTVVLVLGIQHWLSEKYFPLPLAVTFTAMMLPSLTVAGVIEGLYTLFALSLLRKANLRGLVN
jgi:cobalt/nickel transport system permease protein